MPRFGTSTSRSTPPSGTSTHGHYDSLTPVGLRATAASLARSLRRVADGISLPACALDPLSCVRCCSRVARSALGKGPRQGVCMCSAPRPTVLSGASWSAACAPPRCHPAVRGGLRCPGSMTGHFHEGLCPFQLFDLPSRSRISFRPAGRDDFCMLRVDRVGRRDVFLSDLCSLNGA